MSDLPPPPEAMKGWLRKRARSNLITNWKRRWIELDKGVITYYEKYDEKAKAPKNEKGKMSMKDAELMVDEEKGSKEAISTMSTKIYISGGRGENDLMLEAPVNTYSFIISLILLLLLCINS